MSAEANLKNQLEPLKNVLLRLENINAEVSKTQGYNFDTEVLKMLLELTREQVKNEDSSNTAR